MGGKVYTAEQKEWLKANAQGYTYPVLTEMFNQQFNDTRTETGIERMCRDNLGVRHAKAYGYSAEEDAWLIENARCYSCNKLSYLLEEKFGVNHTANSIKQHCREALGIRKGHGLQYEDTHKERLPIGAVTKHGTVVKIKVDNKVNGDHLNYKPYGKWIYEQAFGELPRGYQVIHLDGDANNFAIENLKAVSKEAHSQLAKNDLFGLGKLTSVAVDCYELDMFCKGFKTMRGKKHDKAM